MKKIREFLESAAALVGILIPSGTAWTSYVPPLFPEVGFVVAGLSVGAIYIGFKSDFPKKSLQSCLKVSSFALAAGAIALFTYVILLDATTVKSPAGDNGRYQIGFGKADFGLTSAGEILKRDAPNATLEQWMLKAGGFRRGGAQIIWKGWAVSFAGWLLIVLYCTSFSLWAAGFALLARHHVLSQATEAEFLDSER